MESLQAASIWFERILGLAMGVYLIVVFCMGLVHWWKRDYAKIPNGPVQLEDQAKRLHEKAKTW